MVFPETTRASTVLLLHAHPDDETIATGGLMARLVAEGATVVLVTGSRGEGGEVVAGELSHLEGTPELAGVRERELANAMRELCVTDHRFLGAPDARGAAGHPGASGEPLPSRIYTDSGMQWGPDGFAVAADDAPVDALSLAPLDEVVADIRAVIADVRPDVIVTYDERGGYGHPDHVRMHDAGVAAARADGVALYTVVAAAEADTAATSVTGDDIAVPLGVYRDAKFRALSAHRTQLTVDNDDIVHSGGQRQPVPEAEYFRRFDARASNETAC